MSGGFQNRGVAQLFKLRFSSDRKFENLWHSIQELDIVPEASFGYETRGLPGTESQL
jgi:hypothetical protein